MDSAQLAVQVTHRPALPALPAPACGVFSSGSTQCGRTILDRGCQVPRPGGREKWVGRYLQVRRGLEDGTGPRGPGSIHSAELQQWGCCWGASSLPGRRDGVPVLVPGRAGHWIGLLAKTKFNPGLLEVSHFLSRQ